MMCSAALAPRVVWSLGRDLDSDHLLMLLEERGTGGGAKTRTKTRWAFPWAEWLAFQAGREAAFAEAEPEPGRDAEGGVNCGGAAAMGGHDDAAGVRGT